MKNSRLAVAIHILTLVGSNSHNPISSELMAGSINTNPVVVRRLSSLLKKAGLISSQVGVPGSTLTKDPSDISLLDVYHAIEDKTELFAIHDKPNPNCPVGKKIQATLDLTFDSVQQAMENELASKTLKDVMDHLFE
jgi:DNA-binding IscR family transcriptional regulator